MFKKWIYDKEIGLTGAFLPPLHRLCRKIEAKGDTWANDTSKAAFIKQPFGVLTNWSASAVCGTLRAQHVLPTMLACGALGGLVSAGLNGMGTSIATLAAAKSISASFVLSAVGGITVLNTLLCAIGVLIGLGAAVFKLPSGIKASFRSFHPQTTAVALNNPPPVANRPPPPAAPPPLKPASPPIYLVVSKNPHETTAKIAGEILDVMVEHLPQEEKQQFVAALSDKFGLVSKARFIEEDIKNAAIPQALETQGTLKLQPPIKKN